MTDDAPLANEPSIRNPIVIDFQINANHIATERILVAMLMRRPFTLALVIGILVVIKDMFLVDIVYVFVARLVTVAPVEAAIVAVAVARFVIVDLTGLRNAGSVVQPLITQQPQLPIVPILEGASSTGSAAGTLPSQESVLEVSRYGDGPNLGTEDVIRWISLAEQKSAELRSPNH